MILAQVSRRKRGNRNKTSIYDNFETPFHELIELVVEKGSPNSYLAIIQLAESPNGLPPQFYVLNEDFRLQGL